MGWGAVAWAMPMVAVAGGRRGLAGCFMVVGSGEELLNHMAPSSSKIHYARWLTALLEQPPPFHVRCVFLREMNRHKLAHYVFLYHVKCRLTFYLLWFLRGFLSLYTCTHDHARQKIERSSFLRDRNWRIRFFGMGVSIFGMGVRIHISSGWVGAQIWILRVET